MMFPYYQGNHFWGKVDDRLFNFSITVQQKTVDQQFAPEL